MKRRGFLGALVALAAAPIAGLDKLAAKPVTPMKAAHSNALAHELYNIQEGVNASLGKWLEWQMEQVIRDTYYVSGSNDINLGVAPNE